MIPRSPSFVDYDRPYRRGLVLGLSLAELFLILLFLLLLATIGYWAIVQEETVAKQKVLLDARARNVQLEKDKGEAVAIFGIRHSSRKDKGHGHIPGELRVGPRFAKELAICNKSREDYLEQRGFTPENLGESNE